MIKMVEFESEIGNYKIPKVAIFDSNYISDDEAIKYIENGTEEVKDNFAIISKNTYLLMKKAVSEYKNK